MGSIQRSASAQRSAVVELGLDTLSVTDVQITQPEHLQGTSLHHAERVHGNSPLLLLRQNFNFIELTPSARTFLLELFIQLFKETDETSFKEIFQLPSKEKFRFLQDALKSVESMRKIIFTFTPPCSLSFRLFLSHFILKKSNYSPLIHRRCQIALDQLTME